MSTVSQQPTIRRTSRSSQPRPWQALLAALLAFLAVQGLPATDTLAAGTAPVRADAARRTAAGASTRVTAPGAFGANAATASATTPRDEGAPASESRPSFRATFVPLDDGQAGRPYSYTLQVRNDGGIGGAVRVRTILPPEFSNVRVTAPGFSCTRLFSASGPDAGTLVTCTRNELGSGAVAEVTVEANAPATAGAYTLQATVEPRDEVAAGDAANERASGTVHVRA